MAEDEGPPGPLSDERAAGDATVLDEGASPSLDAGSAGLRIGVIEAKRDEGECSPSRTVAMQIALVDVIVNKNVWVSARPLCKAGWFGLVDFSETPWSTGGGVSPPPARRGASPAG